MLELLQANNNKHNAIACAFAIANAIACSFAFAFAIACSFAFAINNSNVSGRCCHAVSGQQLLSLCNDDPNQGLVNV